MRTNILIPEFDLKRPGHCVGPLSFGRGTMKKLDEATVLKIRADAKRWPQRVLVSRYQIARSTLNKILSGEAWAHVA